MSPAEADLRDVLLRNGFVPCDIAACNCGSWHARYGLRQRMEEIQQALTDAGHPRCNENGNLTLNALAQLVAERDALRARCEASEALLREAVHQATTMDNFDRSKLGPQHWISQIDANLKGAGRE